MLEGRKPFELTGSRGEAVLCLHGFTGSPGTYRKLAKKLNADGFSVSVPLLPGHGTAPADMLNYKLQDWIKATEDAYLALKKQFDTVHVVGLSLGGALAAKLAACHPEISSLTLLAPAFGINPFIARRLGIDRGATPQGEIPVSAPSMIPLPARQPNGGEMDECIFGYDSFPLTSAGDLHEAGAMARKCGNEITVRTCLIYTAADKVVDPAACEEMASKIPGVSDVVCLEESEHNVLLGNDRVEVEDRVLNFIRT